MEHLEVPEFITFVTNSSSSDKESEASVASNDIKNSNKSFNQIKSIILSGPLNLKKQLGK